MSIKAETLADLIGCMPKKVRCENCKYLEHETIIQFYCKFWKQNCRPIEFCSFFQLADKEGNNGKASEQK